MLGHDGIFHTPSLSTLNPDSSPEVVPAFLLEAELARSVIYRPPSAPANTSQASSHTSQASRKPLQVAYSRSEHSEQTEQLLEPPTPKVHAPHKTKNYKPTPKPRY